MLILGHAGITLGMAALLSGVLDKAYSRQPEKNPGLPIEKVATRPPQSRTRPVTWFTFLARRADIRLLLLGSLLPDVIDKPIGQLLFRETFSNGRIFSHTLLFFILVTITGTYLFHARGKTWLLAIAVGTFTHLVFDQVWNIPKTLFWPLYGFAFEKVDLTGWTGGIFYALLHNPEVYVPELMGGGILFLFAWTLVRRRGVKMFIRKGVITEFLENGVSNQTYSGYKTKP